jgi:hypothetical protein
MPPKGTTFVQDVILKEVFTLVLALVAPKHAPNALVN